MNIITTHQAASIMDDALLIKRTYLPHGTGRTHMQRLMQYTYNLTETTEGYESEFAKNLVERAMEIANDFLNNRDTLARIIGDVLRKQAKS